MKFSKQKKIILAVKYLIFKKKINYVGKSVIQFSGIIIRV